MTGPFALRRFQAEAFAAVEQARAAGRSRSWVSLPPGAGKTVLGTELVAGRLAAEGRRAVVLAPNTAIQAQWIATWARYGVGPASPERDLAADVTVLTYQAIATFSPDDEDDDAEASAGGSGPLVDRLHENGRALVAALREAGPLTVVLDECHHLLETWGALLREVLDPLEDVLVLGLTATPPGVLTRRQAEQVEELFGDLAYQASIPAAVREGDLAPFAELAWLVRPSAEEEAWLASSAVRFAELTTELLSPGYGSVPLLTWFDRRIGELPVPWTTFERDEPALATAVLRLVHADLLDLPRDAVLREQHRTDLTAEDWARLVDDWVRGCLARSDVDADRSVLEDLRRAMPGIGFRVTRRGVSGAGSPVDRVLSRSAGKMRAAAAVLQAERDALGERLRAVVVCDHERASPTSSLVLRDAPAEHGSALEVMDALLGGGFEPVLLTGRTVAAGDATARRLVEVLGRIAPDLELRTEPLEGAEDRLHRLVGPWTSRRWTPLVTRAFQDGHCDVLVGTRALLGEGWDAPRVSTLVDLSTASTTSAVTQTRGRALRTDPTWPDKVATTWSVVCVAPEHPGGDSDWRRFVRKHDGYFGVDDDGQVVSGVAHVDARFSPFVPPDPDLFDVVALDMTQRAGERDVVRARWRVGEPYRDEVRRAIRVRPDDVGRSDGAEPATMPAPEPPWARIGEDGVVSTGRSARLEPWDAAREAARDPGLAAHAWVVADAMSQGGLGGPGAVGVRAVVDATGTYRFELDADAATASTFVDLLEELLGPLVAPRWLVARHQAPPPSAGTGWRVLLGRARPVARTWYAVPTELARNVARRRAFEHAWARWFGPATVVASTSAAGEAALTSAYGTTPLDVVTLLRSSWS
jgi:superfamily II DNA or RNA helicase